MKGTVYLIEAYSEFEKVYKIGYTRIDADKRLKQLKTGNPNILSVVYKFHTKHGQKVERTLHRLFKHRRLEGEWFKLEEDEMLEFLDLCEKIESNLTTLKKVTLE